ncbi:S-adenosyl-L-methionine-dependent methyltransferase [Staphylotrichum tortipilum]|uniref:S-adenosyl-L-methionine-dependent methyltransferase n=1 Tax=Staphylotrichum tortipilum TaxID=2831512 RepID=A0AAN6RQE3_9PEZI|nr:S-adenosyl-L-methionine-dependent methyltransferase [Staphylotrichum longicolle]
MPRPPKIKYSPVQRAVISWLDSLPTPLLESVANQVRSADPESVANQASSADTKQQVRSTGKDEHDDARQVLLDRAPKRWVIYEPMALLPSNSFTAPAWRAVLSSPTLPKEPLWTSILRELSPPRGPFLTHLAINEGIPLHLQKKAGQTEGDETAAEENLFRAPTNLQPLHGFPASIPSTTSPSPADLDAALWVSTKQNGLVQTWAPQHTMFSRGNVKEKARLLEFRDRHAQLASQDPPSAYQYTPRHPEDQDPTWAAASSPQRNPTKGKWAVDLYAGIGYFAFCYAALGLRVLCWEVSPWSVEGLRRGAAANGFSVRVFSPPPPSSPPSAPPSPPPPPPPPQPQPSSSSSDAAPDIAPPPPEENPPLDDGPLDESASASFYAALGNEISNPHGAQIIVLHESNTHALARLHRLHHPLRVLHVNCGFLPTSRPVWRDALEMVMPGLRAGRCRGSGGGGGDGDFGGGWGGAWPGAGAWLHLHENVPDEELTPRPKPVVMEGMMSVYNKKGVREAARSTPEEEEAAPPVMRQEEVQGLFKEWMGDKGRARVEHVERVKTYAPGVMHCVFDVFITRN